MNALDIVTVSFVIRESWWKQNGTTFGRLRITFKRDSRFIKTNILLHREDIGKTGKIKNQDIRCSYWQRSSLPPPAAAGILGI